MRCRAIPYEGAGSYLFVSYCHADRETLYPLFEQMASEGYRLWYDDGNRPGEDWVESIESHLEQSSVCLAFISSSSSLSHNCKKEIIYALKCRKKVVPVLIEDAELPKGLRLQLSDMHYLKRWEYPSHGELIKKLSKTKEISDCKSDSSAGLLRSSVEEFPSNGMEKPSEKPAGILSQLSSGGLKPVEVSVNPASSASRGKIGSTAGIKVRLVGPNNASRLKEKEEDNAAPVNDREPEVSREQRVRRESRDSTIRRSRFQTEVPAQVEVEEDPDESTILYELPEEEDDEKTVLFDDADDDRTVAIPRFSPALLLCPDRDAAFVLNKPQITLGRSAIKCDVALEGNASISKHHADIIMLNGKFYLSDAGSTNGTFLNGEQLEPGKQVQLENPAVFLLNDERLIFFSAPSVNRLIHRGNVCLLMNEEESSARIIDEAVVLLNRSHRWPDGTLSDAGIHRNAHAVVCLDENGCTLKDDHSKNGTYLNGNRLEPDEASPLSSGDRITLGKTTLHFYSISLKGDNP